jgi:hypothetical protein
MTPDLQVVSSQFGVLKVTNVGREDVEIADVTINDRDDCSIQEPDNIPVEDLPHVKLKKRKWNASLLHKLWFEGNNFHSDVSGEIEAQTCRKWFFHPFATVGECGAWDDVSLRLLPPSKRLSLHVGESETWRKTCAASIIRVTVKTNRGTEKYEFQGN